MYRDYSINNKNNITPVENLYKNMYINQNYKKKLELNDMIKLVDIDGVSDGLAFGKIFFNIVLISTKSKFPL